MTQDDCFLSFDHDHLANFKRVQNGPVHGQFVALERQERHERRVQLEPLVPRTIHVYGKE